MRHGEAEEGAGGGEGPMHDAHGVHVGETIEDLRGVMPDEIRFQSRVGGAVDDLLQVPCGSS
jgi:hypothetical protein